MIAVVVGPDAFLVREAVNRLVAEHDPDGSSTTRFDGRETSLPEVAAAAGSVGFFGAGRVVVVSDLLTRANKLSPTTDGEPDSAPPSPNRPALDLAPLLGAVAPSNVLILADAAVSTVPAAVKRLLPSDATVVVGDPPRGAALVTWIERAATEAGSAIDRRTAQGLAEALFPQSWATKPNNPRFDRPPDLDLLRNEIDKLAVAAHPGSISPAHVRALTASVPDDRVFRFVEAAVAGELGTATAELDRLLAGGEEPAKLIAQLQQQAELMAIAASSRGRESLTVGRDLGLANPQRMAGVATSLRRVQSNPRAIVGAALTSDRQFKQGRLRQPIDSLHDLVARFAGVRGSRLRQTGGNEFPPAF